MDIYNIETILHLIILSVFAIFVYKKNKYKNIFIKILISILLTLFIALIVVFISNTIENFAYTLTDKIDYCLFIKLLHISSNLIPFGLYALAFYICNQFSKTSPQ